MREMPRMREGAKSTLTTCAFNGYNHNEIIADGEMHDMQNMSGEQYPLLALRRKRGITSMDIDGEAQVPLTGIHGRDQLVYVRGNTVYYNGNAIQGITLSTAENMCPKKIVSFGAYVLIFPDKKFFNTANITESGSMNRDWSAAGSGTTLTMCRLDGSGYPGTIVPGTTPPADPENGAYWLDESGENDVLRQYSAATEEWVEVARTFVKITGTGIGTGLKEYDCIEISGLQLAGEDPDVKLENQVSMLNGSMIIYAAGDDYIVVAGLLNQAVELGGLTGTIHADLEIPDMDYVVESNNRLWGCKYGLSGEQVVNEIYASKLGDFRNWHCFMGLSTDSYAASVGTDGAWTGAITQRGYPVFFKENAIHRVSGQTPSSFSIQTTIARGVQYGSWRSLAVVQENVYYKAREAIMVYDGTLPQPVSEQLGGVLYSDARAGVLGDLYYISMKDAAEDWNLFVYDTAHGTWWKEDGTHALGFGTEKDELYFIDEDENTLVTVRGTSGTPEDDIDWSAEFDLYGVSTAQGGYNSNESVRNEKYVSMFKIRMYLGPDATMKLSIQYNGGEWEEMGTRSGNQLGTFILPVIPKRSDHIRYRLEGSGDVRIYSISRIMEVGGDG